MSVPDAVQTYLRAMSDSPAIADHPQIETFYSMASTTVNTVPWGANASYALALVTAHLALRFPSNSGHIDRSPVVTVQGSESPIRYTEIDMALRDAEFRTTTPGSLYLTLRKRLLPQSFSPVC